jgi:hypothetical protein
MPLEDVEHGVVDPAVVAELDGHVHPPQQTAQEVVEPSVVASVIRGKLHQDDAAPISQFVPASGEPAAGGVNRRSVRVLRGQLSGTGWEAVTLPVAARDAVDVAVPPSAVAEVLTAHASLADKTGTFESALLGDVLHLGACPDAIARRAREQVVDELALRLGSRAAAPMLGHDQGPDLPHPRAPTFVLPPVNQANQRVIVNSRDRQAVRGRTQESLLAPTTPPRLR